jgi:NAD(P)H-dependent FMN reductase
VQQEEIFSNRPPNILIAIKYCISGFLLVPLLLMSAKSMITIISGTNRKDSRTLQVATHYFNLLKQKEEQVHLVSLVGMDVLSRNELLLGLEADLLIPSGKFIFVMPEYNGSFPGVLKALLDNTDIRKCWWYKKALLVGVADGRGGNLRGIEHMTNILHYLRMNVHYNKLPLSRINEEMDDSGRFVHELTLKAITEQLDGFIAY